MPESSANINEVADSGTSGVYKNTNIEELQTKVKIPTSSIESIESIESAASEKSEPKALPSERWYQTLFQVSIPFLLAGVGTIGAGIILGIAEDNRVFMEISALFILVPALMGLKGNLDMTLAARLSTQANLGNMSSRKEIIHMVTGNIALVQVQAIVASILISIFAVGVGTAFSGEFNFSHAMLMAASAILTATSTCFVLGKLGVETSENR